VDSFYPEGLHYSMTGFILLTVHVTVFMKQQAAQVYFSFPIYLEIKHLAESEGKTFAGLVREEMEKLLKKKNKGKKSLADLPTHSWPETDKTLSQHVDDIIYKKDW